MRNVFKVQQIYIDLISAVKFIVLFLKQQRHPYGDE